MICGSPRRNIICSISQNYQLITVNHFYKWSPRNYCTAITSSNSILVSVKLTEFVQETTLLTACHCSALLPSLKSKFEEWLRRHLTEFRWGIPVEEGMLQSSFKCIFKRRIMTLQKYTIKKREEGRVRGRIIPKKIVTYYWTLN